MFTLGYMDFRWLTVSLYNMSIASGRVDDCYVAFSYIFSPPFIHNPHQNRIVIMLDVKAIVLNSHSLTPQLRMLKWLNSDPSINWWQRLWDIPRQSVGPGTLNPGVAGHQIRSIHRLLHEFWWSGFFDRLPTSVRPCSWVGLIMTGFEYFERDMGHFNIFFLSIIPTNSDK